MHDSTPTAQKRWLKLLAHRSFHWVGSWTAEEAITTLTCPFGFWSFPYSEGSTRAPLPQVAEPIHSTVTQVAEGNSPPSIAWNCSRSENCFAQHKPCVPERITENRSSELSGTYWWAVTNTLPPAFLMRHSESVPAPQVSPFRGVLAQRQDLLSWYRHIQNPHVWVPESRTRIGRCFDQKALKIRTYGCPSCSLGSISSWQHILSCQVTLMAKLLLNSKTETKCPKALLLHPPPQSLQTDRPTREAVSTSTISHTLNTKQCFSSGVSTHNISFKTSTA